MRFQVTYPTGASHEVELGGTVVTLGRDPGCDLVLNDPKCSRRHAIVEAGPSGLVVRDAGSANGIYVNDRKTDRAPLRDGDVIRLGDVKVTVLPEEVAGTVIMEEVEEVEAPNPVLRTGTLPPIEGIPGAPTPTRPAVGPPRRLSSPPPPVETPALGVTPRPAIPSPPPRPPSGAYVRPPAARAPAGPRSTRPLTITVLAVLWMLSVPLYAIAGITLGASMSGAWAIGSAVLFALSSIAGGVLAFGLWTGQSWARPLQIAVAAIGILNCPFVISTILVIVYMLRPTATRYFAGEPLPEDAGDAEAAFAAGIVAGAVLGAMIYAAIIFFARTATA
ncbi:MAG TPA: FHA domain-containing protein [Vicinamibacteria bacterium]|nr:FHA domain-containing protein [Vicinamibacteria bacterium]